MSLLLLLACDPATIVLGSGPGTLDDTAPVVDDSEDVEPEPHFASGDYDALLGWYHPDWDWTVCDFRIDLSIDDEGVLSGAEICDYESQNGQTYDLEVEISGSFDEDGEVEGWILLDTWVLDNSGWDIDAFEIELEGQVDDSGDIEISFETVIPLQGEQELIGWIEGEKD